MKKWTMKQKRDRNKRLREFARQHPDMTQRAIAGIFHMDRSRVSRILKKKNEEVKQDSLFSAVVGKEQGWGLNE